MFKSGTWLRINLRCQLQPIWCVSGYAVASSQCTVCRGNGELQTFALTEGGLVNDITGDGLLFTGSFHRRIGVEGERISKASVTARKIAWCINQRLSRCAISYEPSTVPIAASPVTWASHVLQGNTLSLPIGFYWKTSLELRGAAAAPTRGCPCLMNVMGPPWCRSVIGDYLGKGQDSTT